MGNTDGIDKKFAVHAVGFGLTLVIYSMAGTFDRSRAVYVRE